MEKISGIVGGSRRVSSADVTQGPAVRPGAPSFGRPMGASTQGSKDALTTAQKAIVEQQKMAENRRLSTQLPETVQQLADRFFMHPAPQGAVAPEGRIEVGLTPSHEMASAADGAGEWLGEEGLGEGAGGPSGEVREPAEYVPRGSYIDVNA